jgi:outer membrane biosynthesis protein TonB
MDRSEATGLGVAVAGHLVLLAALSLGLASVTRPLMQSDPIEVSFVDEVGLQAAVTEAQMEDPAEAMAPEIGPTEDAAPPVPETPAPEPTPVEKAIEPAPTPAPTPKPKEKSKPAPAKPAPKATPKEKPRSSRLGDDFLKGISDRPKGKATKPRAAVSSRDMASLAQAIIRQIKPCYVVPAGGVDIDEIVTVFRLQLHRNGTVRAVNLEDQEGVNSSNRDYARQVAEAARRAILRCAPLDLPSELYEGGWDDMDIGFRPSSLG